MSRRVVVTGLGMLSPLGNDVASSWANIIAGKCGIQEITSFDTSRLPCKIAGTLKDFKAEDYIHPKDLRKMDPFITFGVAASDMAIKDSGWHPTEEKDQDRSGVMFGSGIGGLGTIERTSVSYHEDEKSRVSPYFIPSSLVNLISGHVAIRNKFTGPNSAVCTACSSGAHAIGDAARMIKYGDADVMVAGGAEAPITPIGVAGFAAAKTLATCFNDRPEESSRPWDEGHAGFIMAEGAGALVLEEYEHAKARGAKIYAEVAGYGMTGDAYHITSPSGIGAQKAMLNSMKDAGIGPTNVNYINAHGTSTKVGDIAELTSVATIFASNKNLLMSSTKSAIGHLLGGAGAVETIFSILALVDQIAPPTLNLHNVIAQTDVDLVPLKAKAAKLEYAMSNSFGFGGTNASLVLKKID